MELIIDVKNPDAEKASGKTAGEYIHDTVTVGGLDPKYQEKSLRTKKVCVLKCGIVRLQNYTEDLSEPGRQLMPVREPDNPYDKWAIKICTLSGTMLGYISALKNQSVARLMDAGKNITVFVDELCESQSRNQNRPTYESNLVPLSIYMDIVDKEEK